LAAISTLGFRGEALPSIASVARFRLSTRERGALAGTEIAVNGGRIEYVRDGGEAPGTQIEVRSLFYNLPARRKFLRTENTESSHVEHQLHLQAIGHPGIGFVLVNDAKVVYQLPPATKLLDRIRDLCGADMACELLEIPREEIGGMTVSGFIGKPGMSRSSRAQQIIFVNGRAVENSTLNFGLREGYHTALMKGQHPVTFLFIEMDPAAVDVNVHPAKREVRFRSPSEVRETIVEVVRRTIESGRGEWAKTFAGQTGSPFQGQPVAVAQNLPLIPPAEQVTLRRDWSSLPVQRERGPMGPIGPIGPIGQQGSEEPDQTQAPATPLNPSTLPYPDSSAPAHPTPSAAPEQAADAQQFKIIGVLGKLYVIMENASGLVLVDQHAAHERILFEELRRRMEEHGVPTQRLLMPLNIQVSPRDADWLAQNLPALHKMGIGIEPFGTGTFKIDALPQFIRTTDPLQLVHDIIDELKQTSATSSKLRLGEDIIATTVCRHAVKANDYLREPELVQLIKDLLACELPYCCPHGRPTMIQINYLELEKKFGRKA
jgi:DNA mismatch repair protein MutL